MNHARHLRSAETLIKMHLVVLLGFGLQETNDNGYRVSKQCNTTLAVCSLNDLL